MAGKIDARLAELGIELPQAPAPAANYVPWVRSGNLLFVAGQVSGNNQGIHKGRLGDDLGLEDGVAAARACALNLIAQAKAGCGGDLDRVARDRQARRLRQLHAGLRPASPGRERRIGPHRRDIRRYGPPRSLSPWARRPCRWALPSRSMPCSRSTDLPCPTARNRSPSGSRRPSTRSPAQDWDACAGDGNPFVSHAFLKALEDGGAVGTDTGWLPQHLVVEDEAGRVSGVAPFYMRGDSYGEYVFDHGWAHAYERAGRTLLPEAAFRRAVLARAGPAPARSPRRLCRTGARGACFGNGRNRQAGRRVVGACQLPAEGRVGLSGRVRLPQTARPAISLAQ